MDTSLEDHGSWTCKAKDDAFARDDHAETSIEVNVCKIVDIFDNCFA